MILCRPGAVSCPFFLSEASTMRALTPLSLAVLSVALFLPAGLARAEGFRVVPPRFESDVLRAEAERLRRSGLLDTVLRALNAQLVLPQPVSVRLIECGESNAYYDPGTFEIQMCLELMEDMAGVLDGQFDDETVEGDALTGAWVGTLLHEVGHALVHVLELPITGREEDVVDQLSAWLLIRAGDADAVLGYAATYYSDDSEAGAADFAGVHALNEQRYYNLLCWAYGSDPEAAEELTASWELPSGRAELCAEEYRQMDRAWTRLLAPHLRRPMSALSLSRPGRVGILFGQGAQGGALDDGSEERASKPAGIVVGHRMDDAGESPVHVPLGKLQKVNDRPPSNVGDQPSRRGINSRGDER